MPTPETGWVDSIIPPARHWVVRYRYIGVSSGRMFDNPDACFASDAICRRIYSRYPVDRDGNYRPLGYPEPPDPADLSDLCECDIYPCSNADDDGVPSAIHSDHDDPGCGPGAEGMRADDRDAGDAAHLLLGNGDAHAAADAGVPDVRDSSAGTVLPEGE